MNYSKRLNLLIATLAGLIVIGISGCGQDNFTSSNNYSEYLILDTYKMSKMSKEDFKTVGEAIRRLDITEQNGIHHIKQTSGEEVNISESLYKFIKNAYDNSNKAILSESTKNKYAITRLKTSSVEPDPGSGNDCVAHMVAYMAPNTSVVDVEGYIIANYGTIDATAIQTTQVVQHFIPQATVQNSLPSNQVLDAEKVGIWYQTSETYGHAVNPYYYDSYSGQVACYDPQTDHDVIIDISQVGKVYIRPD